MTTGSCWNMCERCGEGYNAPLGHECKKKSKIVDSFQKCDIVIGSNMKSIHTTIKSVSCEWSYQPEFDNTTGGTVLMGT